MHVPPMRLGSCPHLSLDVGVGFPGECINDHLCNSRTERSREEVVGVSQETNQQTTFTLNSCSRDITIITQAIWLYCDHTNHSPGETTCFFMTATTIPSTSKSWSSATSLSGHRINKTKPSHTLIDFNPCRQGPTTVHLSMMLRMRPIIVQVRLQECTVVATPLHKAGFTHNTDATHEQNYVLLMRN